MIYPSKIIRIVSVLAGVSLLNSGYAQVAQTAPLPVWSSAPKLTRYLSSLVRFNGYAIQPPRGYAMRQAQKPGLATIAWQGSAPKNSLAPGLLVALGPVPQRGTKKVTAEQLLDNALNTQKRGYAEWTQTPIERGRINGLTFARSYWTAMQGQNKRKLRGVSYFAVDGNLAILLTAQDTNRDNSKPNAASTPETQPIPNADDANTDSDDSLPADVDRIQLAEAAMHTFRRSGGGRTSTPPAEPARPAQPTPPVPLTDK